MKFFLYLLLIHLLFSCDDKEQLKPEDLKKVLLLRVDYRLNKFEGGKEFSYFGEGASSEDLPVVADYSFNEPFGRLTMRYGSKFDTIFDGTEIVSGQGKVNYPKNFDNSIYYFKLDGYVLTKPDNSKFQILRYDLSTTPILYDSIWKAISNLEIVEKYTSENSSSKIGLFLHQPSLVSPNPGDWKWYLIFRE